MSLLLLLRNHGTAAGPPPADPFPKTLTIRDYGHTATVRDRGHTASIHDYGHTATARER